METAQKARLENQVYSTRVLRSEFDKKWRRYVSKSGYVVYVATANKARAVVLLSNGEHKLLIFNKGGTILVGGGASHYSKPHVAITI